MKNESTFPLLVSVGKFNFFNFENLEEVVIVFVHPFLLILVLSDHNSNVKTRFSNNSNEKGVCHVKKNSHSAVNLPARKP